MAKTRYHHIFCREGIWQLRFTFNGKIHRSSLQTGDDVEACRLRDVRIKEIKEAKTGAAQIRWEEAVAGWHAHERDNVGANTLKRYLVSLKMVEPFLMGKAIESIDGEIIFALTTQRKKVAGNATVRRDLTAISKVLRYAKARRWREGNPALDMRELFKEKRDPIVLPVQSQIDAVIATSSANFAALIRAAQFTGCRQNELVTATWRNFNPRARTLEIIGKGNKRRTIRLSDEALALICSVTPKNTERDPKEHIFRNEYGEPFAQAASDFSHFRREAEHDAIMETGEFRRFRYHDLRHLFSVEYLRKGGSIYDLQKHLGHTSVKTTEIYLEFLTPEQAEQAKKAS